MYVCIHIYIYIYIYIHIYIYTHITLCYSIYGVPEARLEEQQVPEDGPEGLTNIYI